MQMNFHCLSTRSLCREPTANSTLSPDVRGLSWSTPRVWLSGILSVRKKLSSWDRRKHASSRHPSTCVFRFLPMTFEESEPRLAARQKLQDVSNVTVQHLAHLSKASPSSSCRHFSRGACQTDRQGTHSEHLDHLNHVANLEIHLTCMTRILRWPHSQLHGCTQAVNFFHISGLRLTSLRRSRWTPREYKGPVSATCLPGPLTARLQRLHLRLVSAFRRGRSPRHGAVATGLGQTSRDGRTAQGPTGSY